MFKGTVQLFFGKFYQLLLMSSVIRVDTGAVQLISDQYLFFSVKMMLKIDNWKMDFHHTCFRSVHRKATGVDPRLEKLLHPHFSVSRPTAAKPSEKFVAKKQVSCVELVRLCCFRLWDNYSPLALGNISFFEKISTFFHDDRSRF